MARSIRVPARMTYAHLASAAIFGVLVLVLLGVLRERGMARQRPGAPADARTAPSVGRPLPAGLARLVNGRLLTSAGDVHYVALLTSGCGSCDRYAQRLGEIVERRELDARDVTVVATGSTTNGVVQRLRSWGVTAVHEEAVPRGAASSMPQTPTTIAVSTGDGVVRDILFTDDPAVLVSARDRTPPAHGSAE